MSKYNPLNIKLEGENKRGRPKSQEGDGRKQSLYLPDSMVKEAKVLAQKLDKSLSWIFQQAFRNSLDYLNALALNEKKDDSRPLFSHLLNKDNNLPEPKITPEMMEDLSKEDD